MAMTSSRPYLIRALFEWIIDSEFTPHLVVNAQAPGVEVPLQYVNKDGQIILNIAPRAVNGIEMNNKAIAFNARFGGIPTDVYVPSHAIMGIYAKENGQGMMFDSEPYDPEPEPPKKDPSSESKKRPALKVVK